MKTSFLALLVAFMLVASMLCGCASGEASDFTLAKTIVPTEDLGLSVGDSLTEAFKEMTNSNPVSSTIFFADFTVFTIPRSMSLRMMNGLYSSAAISLGRPHSPILSSGPTTITERAE